MVKFWQQIIWISFVSKREIVCYSIRRFYYEFIKWEERVVKIMTRRQLVFLSRNQTPLIQVKVKKVKRHEKKKKKKTKANIHLVHKKWNWFWKICFVLNKVSSNFNKTCFSREQHLQCQLLTSLMTLVTSSTTKIFWNLRGKTHIF